MMCWDDDVNDDDDDKDVLSKYDSASNHEECIMTFVRALSLSSFCVGRRLYLSGFCLAVVGCVLYQKAFGKNNFCAKIPRVRSDGYKNGFSNSKRTN